MLTPKGQLSSPLALKRVLHNSENREDISFDSNFFHFYFSYNVCLWDHQIWFSTSQLYRKNNLARLTDHSNLKRRSHHPLSLAFKNKLVKSQSCLQLSDQARGWLTKNTPNTIATHFLPLPPPNENLASINCLIIKCSQICFSRFVHFPPCTLLA